MSPKGFEMVSIRWARRTRANHPLLLLQKFLQVDRDRLSQVSESLDVLSYSRLTSAFCICHTVALPSSIARTPVLYGTTLYCISILLYDATAV